MSKLNVAFIFLIILFQACQSEIKEELKKEISTQSTPINSDSMVNRFIQKRILRNHSLGEPVESYLVKYLLDSLSEREKQHFGHNLVYDEIRGKNLDTLFTLLGEENFEKYVEDISEEAFIKKYGNGQLEGETLEEYIDRSDKEKIQGFRIHVRFGMGLRDGFCFTIFKREDKYQISEKHYKQELLDNQPIQIELIEEKTSALTESEWKKYNQMFGGIDFWKQPIGYEERMICDGEYITIEGLYISKMSGVNAYHKIHRNCPGERTGVYGLYDKLIRKRSLFRFD